MNYVYVLKSVREDLSSWYDEEFKYPAKGKVESKRWSPLSSCGDGLHGFLDGKGDYDLGTYVGAKWLILRVADTPENLVRLSHKCKFRRGHVVFVGTLAACTEFLAKKGIQSYIGRHTFVDEKGTFGPKSVIAASPRSETQVGPESVVAVGDLATVDLGFKSVLSAGDRCKVRALNLAVVTAGEFSDIAMGSSCTATVGYGSQVKGDAYCAVTCRREACAVQLGDAARVSLNRGSSAQVGAIGRVHVMDDCLIRTGSGSRVTTGQSCDVYVGDDSVVIAEESTRLEVGDRCTANGVTLEKGKYVLARGVWRKQ